MRIFLKCMALFMFISAVPSYADRQISFAPWVNGATVLYVTFSNPSTVAQTIHVTFTSTGDYTLATNPTHTGYASMTCDTVVKTTCTNSAAYQTISVGGTLQVSISINQKYATNSSNSPLSGVVGTVTVAGGTSGNQGYILSSGYFVDGGSPANIPVNAGLPF